MLTMSIGQGAPQPIRNETFRRVGFSALEFDWAELQAHKRSHRGDKKYSAGSGTQIIHFSLGFEINRVGVTLFSLLSLGCTAMHFGAPQVHHPGYDSEVWCREDQDMGNK